MQVSSGTYCLVVLSAMTRLCHTDVELIPAPYVWTWIQGNSIGNQHSIVPSGPSQQAAKRKSYPGSRAKAAWWRGSGHQVWMFGGIGFDSTPTAEAHVLDDLWMFSTKQGVWVSLSGGGADAPSARHSAALCGVEGVILVLHGGIDNEGNILNDTWVSQTKNISWLPLKQPVEIPARKFFTHWCSIDRLIIFGGEQHNGDRLDDLWSLSLRTLVWKRQPFSSQQRNSQGDVFPMPRSAAATWTSELHKNGLYMYGGASKTHILSDLWLLNISSQSWSLLQSDSSVVVAPAPRQHCTTWTDILGNLWLYGGEDSQYSEVETAPLNAYTDVWRFSTKTNTWHLSRGPTRALSSAHYGSMQSVSPNHMPGSRAWAGVWTHANATYIFGGLGLDSRNHTVYLNDLWVFSNDLNITLLTFNEWFKHLAPGTVFLMILATFGGIVLTVGAGLFLKKMIEYPKHRESGDFRVRYSPLSQEATFEA